MWLVKGIIVAFAEAILPLKYAERVETALDTADRKKAWKPE